MSGTVSLAALMQGERAAVDGLADAVASERVCYLKDTEFLDAAFQARLFAAAAAFFQLPANAKSAIALDKSGGLRGYVGFEEERTNGIADLKESFEFAQERPAPTHREARPYDRLYAANVWPPPELLPGFQRTLTQFNAVVSRIGNVVFDALVGALRNARSEQSCTALLSGAPCHFSRLIYYSDPSSCSIAEDRLVAHTDNTFFTVALQSTPALEFNDPTGRWRAVEPPANCFTVFAGELAELWSGGRYRACLHRVRNASLASERLSVTTFFLPDLDAVVAPIGASDSETSAASFVVGDREWLRMRSIFDVDNERG